MKKFKFLLAAIPFAVLLTNCKSTKDGGTAYAPIEKKLSYEKDIKAIIETSCTPCHIPPQGKKKPLENYIHVKENINEMIGRVTLPQDNRKFMPPVNKKPALTETQIATLLKWQKQNMPE